MRETQWRVARSTQRGRGAFSYIPGGGVGDPGRVGGEAEDTWARWTRTTLLLISHSTQPSPYHLQLYHPHHPEPEVTLIFQASFTG